MASVNAALAYPCFQMLANITPGINHYNITQLLLNCNISSLAVDDTDLACNAVHTGSPNVVYAEKVCLFMALCFVFIGLAGNIFSLLVFSSKEMRTTSSNVYLLLLACSDSFYLISVFMTRVLTTMRCLFFASSHMDVFNRSQAACKILQYLQDLCSDYSTCLIMAFTVERFVAIYFPIKFKEMFTVRQAKIACGIMFFVVCVIIAPYHFMYMIVPDGYIACNIELNHEELFANFYLAEMTLFRILPVFIIAILNLLIIIKLYRVQKERRRRRSSRTPLEANTKKDNTRRSQRSRDDKNLQITVMLILVSTSYIITFLPVLIHFVIEKLQRAKYFPPDPDIFWIFKSSASTMYILGFAINFFLYTLSGKIFREQLVHILCDRYSNRCQYRGYHNGQTVVTQCPEATTLV